MTDTARCADTVDEAAREYVETQPSGVVQAFFAGAAWRAQQPSEDRLAAMTVIHVEEIEQQTVAAIAEYIKQEWGSLNPWHAHPYPDLVMEWFKKLADAIERGDWRPAGGEGDKDGAN